MASKARRASPAQSPSIATTAATAVNAMTGHVTNLAGSLTRSTMATSPANSVSEKGATTSPGTKFFSLSAASLLFPSIENSLHRPGRPRCCRLAGGQASANGTHVRMLGPLEEAPAMRAWQGRASGYLIAVVGWGGEFRPGDRLRSL